MKQSLIFSCLFAFAAGLASGFGGVFTAIADTVVATARALKNLVVDGFKLAARADEHHPRMKVQLVQAKAFVLRLAKRERPEVSGNWRMCPST